MKIEDVLHAKIDEAAVERARLKSWERLSAAIARETEARSADAARPKASEPTLRMPAPARREPVRLLRAPWRPWALVRVSAVTAAIVAGALVVMAVRPQYATVAAVHGAVTATVDGEQRTLATGDTLPAGALVRTPDDGWVALRIGDDRLSLDTGTQVVLTELSRFPQRSVVIEQVAGRTWNVPATDPSRLYVVRTDDGEAIAHGTAFVVANTEDDEAQVITVEGEVEVRAPLGNVLTVAGERVVFGPEPPEAEPIVTIPLDTGVATALVDALGRACSEEAAEIPGCFASGTGFVILPELAKDLKIRIKADDAGELRIRINGEERTSVTLPGGGEFELEIELEVEDGVVDLRVRNKIERVVGGEEDDDDEDDETADEEATAATAETADEDAETADAEGTAEDEDTADEDTADEDDEDTAEAEGTAEDEDTADEDTADEDTADEPDEDTVEPEDTADDEDTGDEGDDENDEEDDEEEDN